MSCGWWITRPAAPRVTQETKALFQLKFYALVMLRTRGVVPAQLRLIYLADEQILTYTPDEEELNRFERTLAALWQAIRDAGRTGDFPPSKSWLCGFCDYKHLCPEYGGTPRSIRVAGRTRVSGADLRRVGR